MQHHDSTHNWLRWLDGNVDFVRVLSFDFSKAFDTVSRKIVRETLKTINLNPYIMNCIVFTSRDTSRDSDLFNRIISDTGPVLYNLFPPKRYWVLRERGHDFIIPKVETDRFKH